MGLLSAKLFFVNYQQCLNFYISRTQQALNTIMPGTPLIKIYLGFNPLLLAGLHFSSKLKHPFDIQFCILVVEFG